VVNLWTSKQWGQSFTRWLAFLHWYHLHKGKECVFQTVSMSIGIPPDGVGGRGLSEMGGEIG